MTDSGGIGVPVPSPTQVTDYRLHPINNCVLSLAEYAGIIGYDECAFFGVYYDGQIDYDCSMFWTEWQRMNVYRALQEARELMESVTGYPLCPTWITGEADGYGSQQYTDVQPFCNPLNLKYRHFIAGGVQATTDIDLAAPIDYSTEPATVGPMVATLTDTAEVKVYYPGTLREIAPSSVSYAGGMLTIEIPRCRMVLNPNTTHDGQDYNVIANFLTHVDVVRVYNDPSVGGVLVAPHRCSPSCSSAGCAEYTQSACIYPRDKRLGLVEIVPATYSSGWLTTSTDCRRYEIVRLNYMAGITQATTLLKDTLIRLAHSRMAEEPCGCTWVQNLWKRDRLIPDVLSRERLNCPFGPSEGAWVAYKVAQQMRIMRSFVL